MPGPKLIGLQKFYAEGAKVALNLFYNVQKLALAAYPKTKLAADITHATAVRAGLQSPAVLALQHANNSLVTHSGVNRGLLTQVKAEFMMKYFIDSIKKQGAARGSLPTPTTAELTALGYTDPNAAVNQQAFFNEYNTVFIPNLPTLLSGHGPGNTAGFLSPAEKQELLTAVKETQAAAALTEEVRSNTLMLEREKLIKDQKNTPARFRVMTGSIAAAVAKVTATGAAPEVIDAARTAATVAFRAGMSEKAIADAGDAAAAAMVIEMAAAAVPPGRALNPAPAAAAGAAAAAATAAAEANPVTALDDIITPVAIKNQSAHLGLLTDKTSSFFGLFPGLTNKSILEHLQEWAGRTTDSVAVMQPAAVGGLAPTTLTALRAGTDAEKAIAKDIDAALIAENMHPPAANPQIQKLNDQIAIWQPLLASEQGITEQLIRTTFGFMPASNQPAIGLDEIASRLKKNRDYYQHAKHADTYIILDALFNVVEAIHTLNTNPADAAALARKKTAEETLAKYHSDPAKKDKIDKKVAEKYGDTHAQVLAPKLYVDAAAIQYEHKRRAVLAKRIKPANRPFGGDSWLNPMAYSGVKAVLPTAVTGAEGDLAALNTDADPLVAVPATAAGFDPARDSVLVNLHYSPNQKVAGASAPQGNVGLLIDNNFRINPETGKFFATELEVKNRLLGLIIADAVAGVCPADTGNGKFSSLLNDPARNGGIGALPANTKFICKPAPGNEIGFDVVLVTTSADGKQTESNPSAKHLEIIYQLGDDFLTKGLQAQHNKVRQTAPNNQFLAGLTPDASTLRYSKP